MPVFTTESNFTDRVSIFEGDLTATETLQRCITGTNVVILCAAASSNTPGCRIAQDQAEAVITVLRNLRAQDPTMRVPKIVVLSSASTEKKFNDELPWLLELVLHKAAYYIYEDLEAAERYLRAESDWVSCVFVKPGGLSQDVARGHQISEERQQTFLSFKDLAGGMVEVAGAAVEGDRWDGKSVSVLSPGGKAKVEWMVPIFLIRGWLIYLVPALYPYVG